MLPIRHDNSVPSSPSPCGRGWGRGPCQMAPHSITPTQPRGLLPGHDSWVRRSIAIFVADAERRCTQSTLTFPWGSATVVDAFDPRTRIKSQAEPRLGRHPRILRASPYCICAEFFLCNAEDRCWQAHLQMPASVATHLALHDLGKARAWRFGRGQLPLCDATYTHRPPLAQMR